MTTTPSLPILEKSRPAVSILDFDRGELIRMLRQKLSGNKDVLEAYLFGSVAMGQPGFWSDIDLVVVAETSEPFVERPRQFFDLIDLGIPVDILVYTPDEFAATQNASSGFWKNFRDTHLRLI
jgi:predicted nucleotidyltransferase